MNAPKKDHAADEDAKLQKVQVKVCGLTVADEAKACAELGADAIGVVFFPKSPRNVTTAQASAIRAAIDGQADLVGVFVNKPAAEVAEIVRTCGLYAAQLHGEESADEVRDLQDAGVRVIKVLKDENVLQRAALYDVPAYLVELGKGYLPGGNGQGWSWALANVLRGKYPFLLAGGLNADNIRNVVQTVMPDGVDASSSLESAPGRKDLGLVERFITSARQAPAVKRERIFGR